MRRETCWNWACLSGVLDGVEIGLNLSCGVNETSFSENCLWLNRILLPVSGVHFVYRRDNLLTPWHMFGRFHGTLRPTGGEPIAISLNGFVEEQYEMVATQ